VDKGALTSKTICFASAKGGTGKTVLSASLGKFLGILNKKVLLIDTDAATNGLTLFYLDKITGAKTASKEKENKLIGIFESQNGVLATPIKLENNVDFVPATFILSQTDTADSGKLEVALTQVIEALGKKYDYVILDAEAGSDIYAEVAIQIADQVIIVSEYDPISAAGVDRMKSIFAKIMPFEKRWLLYNKVLPEFAKELGKTRLAEKYLPPIPWDAEVVRAFSERTLALDTENGNEHTLAIVRMINAFLGEEIKVELENWQKEKSDSIRKPIQELKEETEVQMTALEKAIVENEYKIRDLGRSVTRRIIIEIAILLLGASYAAIIAEFYGFLQVWFYLVVLTYGIIGIISVIFLEQRRSKKIKSLEIEKMAEVRVLRTKLGELEEVYKKQKALLESADYSMMLTPTKQRR
jgi:cellulose biosynthesis protein BcsQ